MRDADRRIRRAATLAQRLEAELAGLRAENVRLRRRLAVHERADAGPGGDLPSARRDRAAHVRSMLCDRASRNP